MKLGKKKSAAQGAGKKPSGTKGMPLVFYWLVSFTGFALVLVIGVGLLVQQQLAAARSQDERLLRRVAEDVARQLSSTEKLYQGLLRGVSSDPDVVALFASGDARRLRDKEHVLKQLLPDVLGVRLLPPGYDQPDTASVPPLSFASLALLRIAEGAGEVPPLEVHMARSGQAHVAGAAAVAGENGQPIGLIFIAFDAAPVRQLLEGTAPLPGYVALQQSVEGRHVTLFSSPGTPGEAAPDTALPVGSSLLRVVYWHRSDTTVGGDALIWGAAIVLVGLLLSGAVTALQQRRLRKALDADQAVLIHLVEDVMAGRTSRRLQLKVRDFSYTLELLGQKLKAMRAKVAAGAAAGGGESVPAAVASKTDHGGPEVVADDDDYEEFEEFDEPAGSTVGGGHVELPTSIFRSYDVRGIAGSTLTPAVVHEIGRAVGSQAYDRGQQTVIVGRDARQSGEELGQAMIDGLNATGRDVIDLGIVPVPVLYFAVHYLGSDSGVMVTGSHNPPEYNGLKIVLGGEALSGGAIEALRERVESGDLLEGSGAVHAQDLVPDYIERIADDVRIARTLKVVVDCGNGCVGLVAPALYRALGCEVVELYCEVDADAPGHHADPSQPENLRALQKVVTTQGADIGLAFDGDGDCLGVVDSRGRIIWPDRVLMLLAADVLSRHPGGDVVFDVKCSRLLGSQILQSGGRPVMWKSGHSPMKAKLNETGALLAGGWSGHIIFRERWYGFDDAMYAGARLLEILAEDPRSAADVFDEYPEQAATPVLSVPLAEGEQFAVMERVQDHAGLLAGAKVSTIDGLRAEFEEGWGLVRASNTQPALTFRFEADGEPELETIKARFRALMQEAAPQLALPF